MNASRGRDGLAHHTNEDFLPLDQDERNRTSGAYAKNVRADLSPKERAGLKALVKEFPTTYERTKRR